MRLIRLSVEHEVQAWVGRHTDTETQPHTDDPEAETSGASGTGSWIEVDAPKQFTDATNDLEGLLEVYLLR
jgi:hypothetical protein